MVGAEARGWRKLAQDGPLTKHKPAAQIAGIDGPGKRGVVPGFSQCRCSSGCRSNTKSRMSFRGILGSSVTLPTPNKVTAMVLSEDLRGGRGMTTVLASIPGAGAVPRGAFCSTCL